MDDVNRIESGNLIAVLGVLAGVMVMLVPMAIVAVPKGGSLVALLLLVSLLGIMVKSSRQPIDIEERYFLYPFLIYFLVVALNVWWFDSELRELDTASRFLLVLPIFFFLRTGVVSVRWFLAGVIMSSAVVGLIAIHDIYQLDIGRAKGAIDTGVFGLVSATVGLGCLSLLMTTSVSSWLRPLLYVLAMLAGFAVVLTMTRGVWIAVMLSVLYLIVANPIKANKKYRIAVLVSSVLFAGMVYLIPQTGVKDRVHLAVNEVTNYAGIAESSNSSGARLEMWKAAYYIIVDNPLFGVGENNYRKNVALLVKEGRVDPFIGRFNHAHNEFLSTLVEQGVVGLAALMSVFLLPLKGLINIVRSTEGEVQAVALTGVFMAILYIGFSLTSGVFDHQVGVLFFATMYALIMGLSKGHLRTS